MRFARSCRDNQLKFNIPNQMFSLKPILLDSIKIGIVELQTKGNMKSLIQLNSACLFGILLLASCGKIRSIPAKKISGPDCSVTNSCFEQDSKALKTLIESIPKLRQEEMTSRDIVLPESIQDSIQLNRGEPHYDHRERHSSISVFEQFVAFDANAEILWPGATLQGESLKTGLLAPIPLEHAPAVIEISNVTMPSGALYSATLAKPNRASVSQAIQDLLTQDRNLNNAAKASFMIHEFQSLEQGLNSVGMSGKWIGGEAKATLGSSRYTEKNNFIVKFTQTYYTASVEPPKSPEAIFAKGTKVADAEKYMSLQSRGFNAESNPPLYISSVNYGRTLIFIFSSEMEKSKMKATLEAAFNTGAINGDLALDADQQKALQSFETKVLVLGGAGDSLVHLLQGDKMKGINEWISQGSNFSPRSPGVPISFTARYLGDYEVAKVSLATEYEVHSMRPVPITHFHLTFHTLDDDKDREEEVQLWLIKNGQILFSGTFGRNAIWEDHTSRSFDLPIPKQWGLGLASCSGIQLRIRKNPFGSATGCGWNMSPDLTVSLETGQSYNALSDSSRAPQRWGDHHPYDRIFNLQCH
jgi:Thiol-activated cytolysin